MKDFLRILSAFIAVASGIGALLSVIGGMASIFFSSSVSQLDIFALNGINSFMLGAFMFTVICLTATMVLKNLDDRDE